MISRNPKTKAGRLHGRRASKREAAVMDACAQQFITVEWNFANDGGAVGTYALGESLPAGAIVTGFYVEVPTTPTSGGSATLTLSAGGSQLSGDIAVASLAGWAPGLSGILTPYVGVPAHYAGALTAAVGTAAFTAGRVKFHIAYFVKAA